MYRMAHKSFWLLSFVVGYDIDNDGNDVDSDFIADDYDDDGI